MTGHLWKIALVVMMTHTLRELGRRFGPRWGALALGLPCSTGVALIGCGQELGVEASVAMASSCLLGLAGAVSLPLAFAGAIGRGWGPWRSATAGVAAYLVTVGVAVRVDPPAEIATSAVVIAIVLSARLVTRGPLGRGRKARIGPSTARTFAFRTLVPVACLSASIALSRALGPGGAGLMIAFPAVTLTVLVLTELESGTLAAIRMARALPMGNLGMVAFLAIFRLGCPSMGLAAGAVCAYLASIVTLGSMAILENRRGPIEGPAFEVSLRPCWPRAGRRFSPLVEPVAA